MATVELTSIQHTLTEHLLMLSTRCILSTEWRREVGRWENQHGPGLGDVPTNK